MIPYPCLGALWIPQGGSGSAVPAGSQRFPGTGSAVPPYGGAEPEPPPVGERGNRSRNQNAEPGCRSPSRPGSDERVSCSLRGLPGDRETGRPSGASRVRRQARGRLGPVGEDRARIASSASAVSTTAVPPPVSTANAVVPGDLGGGRISQRRRQGSPGRASPVAPAHARMEPGTRAPRTAALLAGPFRDPRWPWNGAGNTTGPVERPW